MTEEKKRRLMRTDEAIVKLLDVLVAEQRHLIALVESQIPEGMVEPLHPVHVGTDRRVITPPFSSKWFSVSVVNDGPDSCWIIVNSEKSTTTPYELKPNETFEVDMGTAKIVDLVCHCETGEALLRVRGVR